MSIQRMTDLVRRSLISFLHLAELESDSFIRPRRPPLPPMDLWQSRIKSSAVIGIGHRTNFSQPRIKIVAALVQKWAV